MTAAPNSNFKNIDRAPYEIGHLLQSLPPDFTHFKEQPEEVHQIADALERHSYNAKGTILSGIETIGTMLFSIGADKNSDIDQHSIANLGCLVRHLSVELQCLIEIEEECLALKEKRQKSALKKGSK